MNKSGVGLANVDNTTDVLKPLSTATISALDLKANNKFVRNNKGAIIKSK